MALSRDSVLMGGATLFLVVCAVVVIWLIVGATGGGDGTGSAITAREHYDGAVQRAADMLRKGRMTEARATLDKAVTAARERNLLPLQNYPSPGESLLWALNRRDAAAESAAAQEFDAYMRRAYRYYQQRQADQYLAVVTGAAVPTSETSEPSSAPATRAAATPMAATAPATMP